MYPIDERDRVVELQDIPKPVTGAPEPIDFTVSIRRNAAPSETVTLHATSIQTERARPTRRIEATDCLNEAGSGAFPHARAPLCSLIPSSKPGNQPAPRMAIRGDTFLRLFDSIVKTDRDFGGFSRRKCDGLRFRGRLAVHSER